MLIFFIPRFKNERSLIWCRIELNPIDQSLLLLSFMSGNLISSIYLEDCTVDEIVNVIGSRENNEASEAIR